MNADATAKVLVIASFPESLLTVRRPLIMSLLEIGINVSVVAPFLQVGSHLRTSLESMGVVVHDVYMQRAGMSPLSDIRLLCRLYRLMTDIRPDSVLGYTIKPVVYGTLAAWLARVPRRFALVTGLGYAFTDSRNGIITWIARFLYRLSLSKAEKVFFQNPDDQKLFVSLGILPDSIPSVVVKGSGVDVGAFVVKPFPKDHIRFLMIARLQGDKGVREYAEAARMVRRLYPESRFTLVGWIDENPDAIARSELDEWIASGCIEYLGRLDDVRPAFADCSVYVLPSYREGTPLSVLEALAMGRPVITTQAPGCRETVIEGENGYLVPVKSVDELANAMIRFIIEPALISRMGLRSRKLAEDVYDVRKVNEVMLREMDLSA